MNNQTLCCWLLRWNQIFTKETSCLGGCRGWSLLTHGLLINESRPSVIPHLIYKIIAQLNFIWTGVLVYAILEIKVKISTHLYETLLHKGGAKGLHLDKQRVLVGLSCRPPRRVLLNVSQTGLQWGDLGRSWTSPPSAKPLFLSCHIRRALIK